MKKLYLIGCTALLLGACNKTSQDYQLTGTFEGDSLEYVLVGHGANNISNADTVRIASTEAFPTAVRWKILKSDSCMCPTKHSMHLS